MTNDELMAAHDESIRNRVALQAVGAASCFSCGVIVRAEDIQQWCDAGQTAICPACGVDALVPGRRSAEFLAQMRDYWFGIERKKEKR